jgi:hypothetical protein
MLSLWNELPFWPALAIFTVLPALCALSVGRIITSLFTQAELDQNAALGTAKFNILVNIYSVVLALTLIGSWDSYNAIRDSVKKEVSSLYTLNLVIDFYRGDENAALRSEMRVSMGRYISAMVDGEWPYLRTGVLERSAEPEFRRMVRSFLDVTPTAQFQDALSGNVSLFLDTLSESRITRLWAHSRAMFMMGWALLFTTTVAVLSFQWFFGGGAGLLQYMLGFGVSLISGLVMFLSARLAYPFSGAEPFLTFHPYLQILD